MLGAGVAEAGADTGCRAQEVEVHTTGSLRASSRVRPHAERVDVHMRCGRSCADVCVYDSTVYKETTVQYNNPVQECILSVQVLRSEHEQM